MKKIILASSNVELSKNLTNILALKGDIFSLESLDDIGGILPYVKDLRNCIFLIDISENYREGLSILSELSEHSGSNHIIALTNSSDPDLLINCFRNGSNAVLYGDSIFNELVRCICTILQGDKYVPVNFVSKTLDYIIELPKKDVRSQYLLSAREKEHIALIASGMNSKEIAYSMKISKKTADNYRNRIMSKLNFSSVADIVKYAIKQQIIAL